VKKRCVSANQKSRGSSIYGVTGHEKWPAPMVTGWRAGSWVGPLSDWASECSKRPIKDIDASTGG
jgi:hypothetical protein